MDCAAPRWQARALEEMRIREGTPLRVSSACAFRSRPDCSACRKGRSGQRAWHFFTVCSVACLARQLADRKGGSSQRSWYSLTFCLVCSVACPHGSSKDRLGQILREGQIFVSEADFANRDSQVTLQDVCVSVCFSNLVFDVCLCLY